MAVRRRRVEKASHFSVMELASRPAELGLAWLMFLKLMQSPIMVEQFFQYIIIITDIVVTSITKSTVERHLDFITGQL